MTDRSGDLMLQLLFILAMIFYFISIFSSSIFVQFTLSILSIFIVVVSFFRTKRFVQLLGLAFIIIGLSLLIINRSTLSDYILSFGLMLNLLTLFSLLPILGIPIRLGKYANRIQDIVHEKVETPGKLYVMTSGISYVLSFFMNVATLPIVYYAIRPSANIFKINNRNKFMTRAILHGFTMPLLWTPTAPIVLAVLALNEMKWIEVIPYLIPLSIVGFILNCILGFYLLKKENDYEIEKYKLENSYNNETGGRLSSVILGIVLFFVIVFLAEILTPLDMLFIVMLLVIPFSFMWSTLIKKSKQFLNECHDHFSNGILALTDQYYIFLAAGFLISTTRLTGTDEVIRIVLGNVSEAIGSGLFVTLLPLVPLGFAFLGMHPIVSLSLMVEALNADLLGVSKEVLTISMSSGAVTAFLMGPYNASIGLMSTIVDESPYMISRWNRQFTIGFLLIVMGFLVVLQILL